MSHRKRIYQDGRKELLAALEQEGRFVFSAPQKGIPVDFSKEDHCVAAAVSLGQFHVHARKALTPHMVLPQKDPFRYLRRTEKMLTREKASQWIPRIEYAFLLLCGGVLEELCRRQKSEGEVRYGSIHSKGLILDGKTAVLTRTEKLSEDLAILDLWQLLERYLFLNNEKDGVFKIIEAYEAQRSLPSVEKRALYGFLLLPYTELKKKSKREVSKETMAWYEGLFEKGMEV